MFVNLSKEKLIRITIVSLLIVVFILVSFGLNDKLHVGESYQLYSRKMIGQISYIWSHKMSNFFKNPIGSVRMLAGVAYFEDDGFVSGEEARSIPVLAYHGLPSEGIGQISHETFVEQMEALYQNGWKTITLEEFDSFVRGQKKLPEKSFLLTFDDGRKDTFYPADPVLKDFGFHAVMFAISKKSTTLEGSPYYMSEYELVDMEKSGRWEVESHGRDSHDWYSLGEDGTIGHFFSNRLWLPDESRIETEEEFKDRIIHDLTNSKKDLEEALHKKITAFAYPFSDFGQDSINYPKSLEILNEESPKIYSLAFYQIWPGLGETFNYPEPNLFMAKRIEPASDWSGQFLADNLESGISKDLPYLSNSFGPEWIDGWGRVKKGDVIELQATENTTGSSVALNGSWWWQDYTFTTDVKWSGGTNIVLVARRDDENNYYGCNWSHNQVAIKRASGEYSYNILTQKYDLASHGAEFSLGIRVASSEISCLVDNRVILKVEGINNRIQNGGIGIEIWDAQKGSATASFGNISVTPSI